MTRLQLFINHAKNTTDLYAKKYIKAARLPNSRKAAIDAKCIECTGFEDSWNRIKHCTIEICPLWLLRPYQKSILESDNPSSCQEDNFDKEITG